MKKIALGLMLSMANVAWAGDLKLQIHGNGIGGKTLLVSVHTSADDFPTRPEKAITSSVVANRDFVEYTVPNLQAGEYAVAVYADMNGNGKLDANFIGIPKEPVGVSRDAKAKFGPPKFADAAFKVGDSLVTMPIELK